MESLWAELHHHTTNYDDNNDNDDKPVVLDGPTWNRYWHQANRIFQAYRNVVELHPHAPHVFCLLDQLVLLKQQQQPLMKPSMPEEEGHQEEEEHDSASFSSFSAPPVRTSWSPTLLIHALRKWHIMATDRTSGRSTTTTTTPSSPIWTESIRPPTTTDNHVPQQQQQQQHQQDEQPETTLSPPLTNTPTMTMPLHQVSCPYNLLHKIQTYVQAGLFPPRSAYYGLLLNGMFPRYSPQELQDMMLQSMNHPPTPTPNHDDNVAAAAAAAALKDETMKEGNDHNDPSLVDAASSLSSLWTGLAPDGLAFYTVLQAWRQAKRPQECHALVQEYCRRVQEGQILVQAKDVRLFQTAIAAWAEQLSSSSSSLAFKNHRATFSPQPNFQGSDGKDTSTTTLRTRESDLQAAERAMELYQMLQDTARYASFDMVADTPLMHTLIQMWYRVQRPDQVEALFQAMQQNKNKSRSDAMGGGCGPPTWETHRLRISAWAANRNGGHPHPEMATQALKEMLDAAVAESVVVSHNHDSITTIPPLPPGTRGGPNGLPNKLDCDMVLRAWCRSQHAQAGYKAEQVLEHMIQVCDTTLPQSASWSASSQPLRPPWVAQCCPDAVTVNMVLTAHARCHAHGRVYQLWQQFSSQFPHIPLDVAVHTTVLQSLIAAASQDPWAQERAWELFEHLKGMQQQERQQQQQQVHGFQSSYSLPARKRKLSSTQALDEVVYQNMMELAVQQQLPERVEALFQEMKKQGQGLRPSRYCHLHRVEAWSLAGNPHQTAQALKEWIADAQDQEEHYPEPGSTTRFSLHPPKTHDWNHLLHAWIRWGFHPNTNMADGISASPDMDLMSCINADVVQHRQHALQQAEQVVREMWNFVQTSHFWSGAPTASSYTILMGGHVKFGLPQAGQEALRLLHEMNQLHQQEQEQEQQHHSKRGSMQPTMMTYATVLSALSLSTAVDPQQAAHEMHTLLDSLCQEARGQFEQQQQQGHNAAAITKRWSSAQDPATRRKELERSVNKMVNAADAPHFSMNVRQELRAKVIELQRLVLVRNDPPPSN